jgi:hypothetical protein
MDASHDIGGDASMDDGVLLPILLLRVCWFVFASLWWCGLVIGGCSVSCS